MDSSRQVRVLSAAASAAIVCAVVIALVLGLAPDLVRAPVRALVAVDFAPEPSPSPRPTPPPPQSRKSGAKDPAGAAGKKAQATQVVASPVPQIAPPPPVVAAPVAGKGDEARQGAALAGTGSGAGGLGNGTGGGGNGGNGAGMPAVGPRQIRGKLSSRDLPAEVLQPGQSARVGVRYIVETDGSVTNCRVTEPSGFAVADQTACRLIEQRFVYRPARDESGQPVRSTIVEWHTWFSREE